ncbi:MAG: LysR substrate-binding domain-containing protein [Asticcacaulis sp.]
MSVLPEESSSVPASATGRRRETGSLSIGALKAFVAVVDQGSFSRAAQTLGVSQPNVSNQINSLEQICGVRLLNRRTQNQTLTEAGRELYTRARLVLSRVEDFEATANLFTGLKRGRLTVGFSTPPITMQMISRFQQTWPDVSVLTRLGNTRTLTQDVLDCRVDVAILSLLEPDPALACHRVFEQGLNVMVPLDHALAKEPAISPQTLATLPLVAREDGSVTRALTEIALGHGAACLDRAFVVESREAAKEATAQGLGFALVLDGETGSDSRLCAVPVAPLTRKAGVYLVTLRENLEIPAVSAFVALAGNPPG